MEEQIEQKKNVNTGLISLEIVARFNKIDIDMTSIVRDYGIQTADISPEEIIRIAQNRGFKIKKKNFKLKDVVPKYPLPAIVRQKDGKYVVVLAIKPDENKVMILVPLERTPQAINLSEFQETLQDYVLVLKHKLMNDEVKFGFKWFFVEILKYKKIVGQVLLGSFVIQLFGLVTPLFTQVIWIKSLFTEQFRLLMF